MEVGGGTALGARAASLRLTGQGATALVSFGLAGGLDPALAAGALIVPDSVLVTGTLLATDRALSHAFGGPTSSSLLAGSEVVADAREKARLWRETGCAALDLESGAVAEVARAHGLPFAVVRAVCDTAATTLPPAALVALGAAGRIGAWRVAASIARDPAQLGSLVRLAWAAGQARRTLAVQVARTLKAQAPTTPDDPLAGDRAASDRADPPRRSARR